MTLKRNVKCEVVNKILASLFARQQENLLKRIGAITDANNKWYDQATDGFKHKGTDYFSLPELSRKLWVRLNPLHETLHGELTQYIQEETTLHISNKRVELFLSSIVVRSITAADIKKLLPAVLHQDLPESIKNDTGKSTFTDEYVEEFNEKYTELIHIVNTRIMTKILTG